MAAALENIPVEPAVRRLGKAASMLAAMAVMAGWLASAHADRGEIGLAPLGVTSAAPTDRRIEFAPESHALPSAAAALLERLADELKSNRKASVSLLGVVDKGDLDSLELALINQRLHAISSALEQLGVWSRQIVERIDYSAFDKAGCRSGGCRAVDSVMLILNSPQIANRRR